MQLMCSGDDEQNYSIGWKYIQFVISGGIRRMAFSSRTKFIVSEAIQKSKKTNYLTETDKYFPFFPNISNETSCYFIGNLDTTKEREEAQTKITEYFKIYEKYNGANKENEPCSPDEDIIENYSYVYSPFDDSDNDKDYNPSSSSSESELEEASSKKKRRKENKNSLGENEFHHGIMTDDDCSEKRYVDEILPLQNAPAEVLVSNDELKEQNIIKKRSHLTSNEKIERNKRKHPMKDKCPGKCRRDCEKLTDISRTTIWNHYWNMDYTSRRKWLAKHVTLVPVKRLLVAATKHRAETRIFSLPLLDSTEIKVCRFTFLSTLGYTNDSVITELVRAMKREPCGRMVKEGRGIHKKNAIDKSVVINHIQSFHPFVSHYRRKNAPNRKYLPRELTFNQMYRDFTEKYPNTCKIETYRKVLRELNISMCPPKSDLCDECQISKDTENESESEKLKAHKLKAAKANSQYKKDSEDADRPSENSVIKRTFSMDLQKVMLLPIMPQCKKSFFISRLVAFNETFATLNKNSKERSYCVMWHEALAGRKAEALVDSIIKVITEERDVDEFIFWADNCTGQNKNWKLFTSLVSLVNQPVSPTKITIRYLTKGHTHMSADGVHGNIEKRIGRKRSIYDFQELVDIVRTCRKNLEVLQPNEFKLWQSKKRSTKKQDDPLKSFRLSEIVEVVFTKGNKTLKYKLDFDHEEKELDFLQKKVVLPISPELLPARGISVSKKEQILKELVPLMPVNRRIFWENLPSSQTSTDLLTADQNIDSDTD